MCHCGLALKNFPKRSMHPPLTQSLVVACLGYVSLSLYTRSRKSSRRRCDPLSALPPSRVRIFHPLLAQPPSLGTALAKLVSPLSTAHPPCVCPFDFRSATTSPLGVVDDLTLRFLSFFLLCTRYFPYVCVCDCGGCVCVYRAGTKNPEQQRAAVSLLLLVRIDFSLSLRFPPPLLPARELVYSRVFLTWPRVGLLFFSFSLSISCVPQRNYLREVEKFML